MSRRIYLCACGCVHVETRHARRSIPVDVFLARLRQLARRPARPVDLDDLMPTTDQRAGHPG